MAAHPSRPRLQQYGCGTLRKLAIHGTPIISKLSTPHTYCLILHTKDKLRAKIVEEGAVGKIVTAMNQFPDHSGVQEQACAALWNLASANGSFPLITFVPFFILTFFETEKNRKKILEAGGVQAIVLAMQHHTIRGPIQEYACGALWNLALAGKETFGFNNLMQVVHFTHNYRLLPEKGRQRIGKEKGIIYVLAAMQNHRRNPRVQEQACAAIWNLAADSTPILSNQGSL